MSSNSSSQAGLIVKAFAIIQLLSTKRTMPLKEIALQTNMSMPMAHKCIQTLCDLGYAYQQSDTQQYGLTFRLASVCSNMLSHYNITELSMAVMQKLSDEAKETIHLAIRDDNECVYLHKIDSKYPLRLYSRVGKTAPLYCTGLGKVLLAFEDKTAIDNIVSNIDFVRYTDSTITDKDIFKQHLEQVRQQGFAEDIEEHALHVRCLAYPIFDFDNKAVAGISISAPIVRWTDELHTRYHEMLSEASREISKIMGS